MNLPLYISKRYFISKKSHNIINIISWISVGGISIGTMSLIIVLSVFNGFEHLVTSLFSAFNPEIQISVKEGKSFRAKELPAEAIKNIDGIAYYIETVEENALLKYGDKQYIATIKGVSENYNKMNSFDTTIINGSYFNDESEQQFAVFGYGVAYNLNLNLNDITTPVSVYIPRRGSVTIADAARAFKTGVLFPSGFFSVQQEIDMKYVIVPIAFARDMLEYTDETSKVEIGIKKGEDKERIIKEIKQMIGNRFIAKDRYQQEEMLFKIMKSEKWAVFLILSFIILIAGFNVIGSVTMLILDKKKDIAVLGSMGADSKLIKRIFVYEGMMINLGGALTGLLAGFVVCYLQMEYGIVKLQTSGSFIINAYPVKMEVTDFVYVFLTVLGIAYLAAYIPSKQLSKRYLYNKLS